MTINPYEPPKGIMRHANKVLAVFAALPLLYLAAYLADVRPEVTVIVKSGPWPKTATYRIGGRLAESIFSPANAIDRKLRPSVWLVDRYDQSIDPSAPPRPRT